MNNLDLYQYLEKIKELISNSKYGEAVAHCQHILLQQPRHIGTYKLMGQAYLAAGIFQQAADVFKRVLSADPSDFDAHYGLALVAQDANEFSQAIWHIEHAHEIESNNNAALELRESLYQQANLPIPETKGMSLPSVARLYVRGGIYDQAVEELTRLLDAYPDRYDWKILLVEALWGSGKNMEALKQAESLLELLPNSIVLRAVVGDIWLQNERETVADQHLDILQELVLVDKSHLKDHDLVSQILIQTDRAPERYSLSVLEADGSFVLDENSWQMPELGLEETGSESIESFDWILDQTSEDEYISLAEVDGSTQPSAAVPLDADSADDDFLDLFDDVPASTERGDGAGFPSEPETDPFGTGLLDTGRKSLFDEVLDSVEDQSDLSANLDLDFDDLDLESDRDVDELSVPSVPDLVDEGVNLDEDGGENSWLEELGLDGSIEDDVPDSSLGIQTLDAEEEESGFTSWLTQAEEASENWTPPKIEEANELKTVDPDLEPLDLGEEFSPIDDSTPEDADLFESILDADLPSGSDLAGSDLVDSDSGDVLELDDFFSDTDLDSAMSEEDPFLLETNENANVGTGFTGWLNQVESDDIVSSLLPSLEPETEDDSALSAEAADGEVADLFEAADPVTDEAPSPAAPDAQEDDLFELDFDLPASEEEESDTVDALLAEGGLLDDGSDSAVQVTQVEDVGFTDWLSDFDGDSTDSILEEMSDSGFAAPSADFLTPTDDDKAESDFLSDIPLEETLFENDPMVASVDESDLPLLDNIADEAASPGGEDVRSGLTSWLGNLDDEKPVRSPAEDHPVSLPLPERSDVTEDDLASWLTEFDAGQDDEEGMPDIVDAVSAETDRSASDIDDLLSDGDVADLLAEGMPTLAPDSEPFVDDTFDSIGLDDSEDLSDGSIFDRAEPFSDSSSSSLLLDQTLDETLDEALDEVGVSPSAERDADLELEGLLAGDEDEFHAADTLKDLFIDQEMLDGGDDLGFDLDETLEDDSLDLNLFESFDDAPDDSAAPTSLGESGNLDWLGDFEEGGGEPPDVPVSDILEESGFELELDPEIDDDPLKELFFQEPTADETGETVVEGAETVDVDDGLTLDELLFGDSDSAELESPEIPAGEIDVLDLPLGETVTEEFAEDSSIVSTLDEAPVAEDAPLEELSFDDFLAELEDEEGGPESADGESLADGETVNIDVIEGASEDMLRAEELSWLSLLEDAEEEKSAAAEAALPESAGTPSETAAMGLDEVDGPFDLAGVESVDSAESVVEPKSEYVTRPLPEEDLLSNVPVVEGEILNFAYEESLLGPDDEIELDSNMLEYANTATLPDWLTQSTEPTDLGVEIENKAEPAEGEVWEPDAESSQSETVVESTEDDLVSAEIDTEDDLLLPAHEEDSADLALPTEIADIAEIETESLGAFETDSVEPELDLEFDAEVTLDMGADDNFEDDLGLDELDALLAEVDTSEPSLDIDISAPVRDEIEADEIFDLIDEAEAEIEAEYNRRQETSEQSQDDPVLEADHADRAEDSDLPELDLIPEESNLLDLLDQPEETLQIAEPEIVEAVDAAADNEIGDLEIEQNEAPQPPAQEIGLDRELEGNKMSSNPKQRPERPEGDDLEETLNWLEELALYDTEGEIQVPTGLIKPELSTAEPDPVVSDDPSVADLIEEEVSEGLEPSTQSLSWLDEIIPEEDDLENPPTARWDKAQFSGAEVSEADEVTDDLFEDDLVDLDPLSSVEELEIDPELREVAQSSSLLDALDELDELDADGNLSISALLDDQETVHEEESDSLLAWINEESEQASDSALTADSEPPVLPELTLDDVEIDPVPIEASLDAVDSIELPAIDSDLIEPELPEPEPNLLEIETSFAGVDAGRSRTGSEGRS